MLLAYALRYVNIPGDKVVTHFEGQYDVPVPTRGNIETDSFNSF